MNQPFVLLDTIIKEFELKNDAQLSKFLGVSASVVCKWRSRTQLISGDRILLIYDKTGWTIEKIRRLLIC
jgi:hypothetical protein